MYRRLLKMGQKVFHASSSSSSSSSSSKIQALYDLCKQHFTPSGTTPASPEVIQKLRSLMDTVTPADLGLSEDVQEDDGDGSFGLNQLNRAGPWVKPIAYQDIHECDSFTMCIFFFPTSSVIPLHDHPGMNVFSKVLYGSLHVKAYDWVEPAIERTIIPNYSPARLARLAADKVLTSPCETQVLYPKSGGNVHCFTAVTPCAVLDILTPPYNIAAGRTCTYYHDYPSTSFTVKNENRPGDGTQEDYAWLARLPEPANFYTIPREYHGPAIQV